jgi:hypothetical protein
MFNVTLLLIKKFNIISSKKFIERYRSSFISFINNYLKLNDKNIRLLRAYGDIITHFIYTIIAFLYSKKYIKKAKKTNNPKIIAFILFIIYCLFNIYINDAFKVYNKSLAITKCESNILIISTTITYSGLLYYFETIKNKTCDLINK